MYILSWITRLFKKDLNLNFVCWFKWVYKKQQVAGIGYTKDNNTSKIVELMLNGTYKIIP